MAFNLFNYPEFVDSSDSDNFAAMLGPRETAGNLLHTSVVYQDKVAALNYFLAGGWSQTQPDESGLFNQPTMTGVIPNTDNENGYSLYAGVRYDMDDLGLKLGFEYNYGSEYWIAMTPGHDDIYRSKLATRVSVYEVYAIYDLPVGEYFFKHSRTFVRLGYQHYEYDYTGSGDWNYKPFDVDGPFAPANTIESADQVYATFEVLF